MILKNFFRWGFRFGYAFAQSPACLTSFFKSNKYVKELFTLLTNGTNISRALHDSSTLCLARLKPGLHVQQIILLEKLKKLYFNIRYFQIIVIND